VNKNLIDKNLHAGVLSHNIIFASIIVLSYSINIFKILGSKFDIYFKFQFVFSQNLRNFENLSQTNYNHFRGDAVTFIERLTAIGGNSRKVEVYEGGIWNDQKIPSVGNEEWGSYLGFIYFTSLAIENQLYVFGKISVRLKCVLKLNYFLLRWTGYDRYDRSDRYTI